MGALWLTVAALGAAPLPGSALELSPPYGDRAFAAFSVFDPTVENNDAVVVVLHGFLSAIPNGTYKRLFRKFHETHQVIGVNYDPLNVTGTRDFLTKEVILKLEGKRTTVLGTSLGGWWALQLGQWAGAERIIILNPVLSPEVQLRSHVGKTELNPRRNVHYVTTTEAIAPYAGFVLPRTAGISKLIILTRDDPVMDYRVAAQRFRNDASARTVIYDTGGHTIALKRHPALDLIHKFVVGASN